MHPQQEFFYETFITGFVTNVYPVDPADRRLYVDAVPADCRGLVLKAPVFFMPGIKRNLRKGAQVLIGWFDGNAQLPFVFGHSPNNDSASTYNQDPLNANVENFADLVVEHPETGAFIRFRDINASAGQASSVDGGPAHFELTLRSGMSVTHSEYNPPGYPQKPAEGQTLATPPKPPRAKRTIQMPTGGAEVWDEPDTAHQTWTRTTTGGHSATMDDVAQKVEHKTAGGNLSRLDDQAKQILHQTVAGLFAKLDDEAKQIVHQITATLLTVIDGEANAISHVAQQIGLGDLYAKLDATMAGINNSHMTQFEKSMWTQRLKDYVQVTTAIAPYTNNPAAAIAAVQALLLAHIAVPSGSGTVRIKT